MTTPRLPAFVELTTNAGFELYSHAYGNAFQWHETIVADGVALHFSKDRGDVERRVSLAGSSGPHSFRLSELLLRIGLQPTQSNEDFLTAAAKLDKDTVTQLAR